MKKTLLAIAAAGLVALAAPRPAAAHSVFFGFSVPGFAIAVAPPPPPVVYYPRPSYEYYEPEPVYAAPVYTYYHRGYRDYGARDYGDRDYGYRDHGRHRGWWKHHRDCD